MTTPDDVLSFWFSDADLEAPPGAERFALWFQSTAAQDQEIRDRFGDAIALAQRGELDGWSATPAGRLALVLTLDQLPRNAARGSAGAFAGDALALRHALRAIDRGEDRRLPTLQRIFLYLPLEHAEDLAHQERCVALMAQAAAEAPAALGPLLAQWVSYAEQHRDIVARFGRFPHRNAALGRVSTPDELAFLSGGGATFGQGASKG